MGKTEESEGKRKEKMIE